MLQLVVNHSKCSKTFGRHYSTPNQIERSILLENMKTLGKLFISIS